MSHKFCTIGAGILIAMWVAVAPAGAFARLVKSESRAAVYELDDASVRHVFPNAATYRSWYGNDFSAVTVIPKEELAGYRLGKNITFKPGKWLVKVPSAPTVYAVEQGGVLRPIATPEVAQAIWGKNWRAKVVDLPEAFFENYWVGEPLDRGYQLPSSIVYRAKGDPAYYWKQGNLLQPFQSLADVVANGYAESDVVTGERTFPVRAQPIAGKSARVFDPFAPPRRSTEDCGSSTLQVALLLVSRGELDPAYPTAIEQVRARLPEAYAWATRELGTLTIGAPAILPDDGMLSRPTEKGGRKLTDEVPRVFYDTNPDAYDFLIVFTNFAVQQDKPNHEANHVLITNAVSGTGLPMQDAADLFGSQGKLKAIILVGDLGRFDVSEKTDGLRLDNILLHEIAHQWSGAVKFRDDGSGQDSTALLRDDGRHWNYYAGFLSPLGGSGWIANGDGTFTTRLSQQPEIIRRPYADLDLYLMGLLPWQAAPEFFYLEPATGEFGNTIRAQARTVTVEQVIAANGTRRCELR